MLEILESSTTSNVNHNMRLHEAECASKNGIVFDANWYSITPYARSMMIASALARNIIDNLAAKQARSR